MTEDYIKLRQTFDFVIIFDSLKGFVKILTFFVIRFASILNICQLILDKLPGAYFQVVHDRGANPPGFITAIVFLIEFFWQK